MPKPAKRSRDAKPFALSSRQSEILKNWEAAFGLAPKLAAIVEDCAVSVIYERLANGQYEAVKDGTRTKVTTESIKRRRASLPRAEFRPLKRAAELQP